MITTVKELIENLKELNPEEKICAEFFTKTDVEGNHNEKKENPPLTDIQWAWFALRLMNHEELCNASWEIECEVYEEALKKAI
jgi:hypothetical protein